MQRPDYKTDRDSMTAVIVAAGREAQRLGHSYVGDSHFLWVLIQQNGSHVAGVLDELGLRTPVEAGLVAHWTEERGSPGPDA